MLQQQDPSQRKWWNWWIAGGSGIGALLGSLLMALLVTPTTGWIGVGIGAFLGGLSAGLFQKRTH